MVMVIREVVVHPGKTREDDIRHRSCGLSRHAAQLPTASATAKLTSADSTAKTVIKQQLKSYFQYENDVIDQAASRKLIISFYY